MNVQVFNNPSFGEIRTAGTADNPMFCLSDVCEALGLTTSKVVQRLSKDVLSKYPLSTVGGEQLANFVNEDGLYDVILDSRKKSAKAFRKWVTSEVLPSIRKTGSYSVDKLSRKDLALMVIKSEEEKERLQIENKSLLIENRMQKRELARKQSGIELAYQIVKDFQKEVDESREKVKAYDKVINSPQDDGLFTTRQIAQEIGLTDHKLYAILMQIGVLYKQSDTYMMHADYVGWQLHRMVSHVVNEKTGRVRTYLKWSNRGRVYIHALHDCGWDKRKAYNKLREIKGSKNVKEA